MAFLKGINAENGCIDQWPKEVSPMFLRVLLHYSLWKILNLMV